MFASMHSTTSTTITTSTHSTTSSSSTEGTTPPKVAGVGEKGRLDSRIYKDLHLISKNKKMLCKNCQKQEAAEGEQFCSEQCEASFVVHDYLKDASIRFYIQSQVEA